MNKLTAEVARRDIGHLKSFQSDPKVGLSLKEEKYLQALEIALPVLEQQENRHKWDAEGERCVKCGDKDWFAGSVCEGKLSKPQPTTDTYRQIENDGWIEWKGGPCPVANNADVEVRRTDRHIARGKAANFYWQTRGLLESIIAYRVIENDGREG